MTSTLLWALVAVQVGMGAFDTLYHHEMTERLAWRPSQRRELWLHAVRNMLYAALFVTLGWSEPHGLIAVAVIVLLIAEVLVTLADFVEEDVSRRLPASERINHTLLAVNYGAILVLLVPVLIDWAGWPTAIVPAWYGNRSVLASVAALAVAVFGLRDAAASARLRRLPSNPVRDLVQALPPHRSVLITGATGFVGRRLVAALAAAGHDVVALVRRPDGSPALPTPVRIITSLDQVPSDARIDAVVNLAGEPIAGGRWTSARRRRIIESRTRMTAAVTALIERLDRRPDVLVSGSAVGWYGL